MEPIIRIPKKEAIGFKLECKYIKVQQSILTNLLTLYKLDLSDKITKVDFKITMKNALTTKGD